MPNTMKLVHFDLHRFWPVLILTCADYVVLKCSEPKCSDSLVVGGCCFIKFILIAGYAGEPSDNPIGVKQSVKGV